MMEARRSSSGNLTKSISLSSRWNGQPVALLLQETALLPRIDVLVRVVERALIPLGARIGHLVTMIGEEMEMMVGRRTGIWTVTIEGTGTTIGGRIGIGMASGGGIEAMTRVERKNAMKTGDGIETGMVTVAIVIQRNEIAQETDARVVVARGIDPLHQGNDSLLLYQMYLRILVA